MDSPVGRGPNKSVARSCQGVSGNCVILRGSGFSSLIGIRDMTIHASLCPYPWLATTLYFWGSVWCLLCPNVLCELGLKISLGVTVVTQCVYPSRPTVQSHLTHWQWGRTTCMAWISLFSSSSAADASSTVLVVSALGVAFTATNLTYSSASCLCVCCFFTDETWKRVSEVLLAGNVNNMKVIRL